MEVIGFEFSPAGGFMFAGLTAVVVMFVAFVVVKLWKDWKRK